MFLPPCSKPNHAAEPPRVLLVDQATTTKMRYQLAHAKRAFGDKAIDKLTPYELDAWRAQLPARTRHHYFRAFRQVLGQAVTLRLLERNPTDGIKNKRAVLDEDREIQPFADWDEVEAIAAELHPRFRAVATTLVGTGLRPEELWARASGSRLEKRRLEYRACLHSGATQAVQEKRPPEAPGSATGEGARSTGGDAAASRHPGPLPVPRRRLRQARNLPPMSLDACAPGRRNRAQRRLRDQAHVRLVEHPGRCPALLPQPIDGNERRDDLVHLRPPCP